MAKFWWCFEWDGFENARTLFSAVNLVDSFSALDLMMASLWSWRFMMWSKVSMMITVLLILYYI